MTTRKNGFVLVCVLWVLAILTVLTVGFGHRALLDRRAAAYSLDRAQAMMMARGAVQRGAIEVRNKAIKDAIEVAQEQQRAQRQGKKPRPVGGTHLGQPWARPKNLLHGDGDCFDAMEGFKDDRASYIIQDAERWIDINTAPKKLLEEVDSLSRSAIRRIWRRRTKGVHDGEGRASFHAVEELRYLRGIDEDNWNGERSKTGLRFLLTSWGGGKINLNTASAPVLECVPDLKDGDINTIMKFRAGKDGKVGTGDDQGFANMEHLAEKTKISGDALHALKTYCKVSSTFFKITGVATRRGGTVRAVCSAWYEINGSSYRLVGWQEEALGA